MHTKLPVESVTDGDVLLFGGSPHRVTSVRPLGEGGMLLLSLEGECYLHVPAGAEVRVARKAAG